MKIYQANLPDDVNRFLHDRVPDDPSVPVVITNTWMTSYLGDKGQSLMVHLDQWAADQQRPVLWLQWEPPRDGSLPPVDGWCAWTADLWQGQTHRRWLLGWAHPHGLEVAFGPGMADWLKASPIAS